jgi:hypothetical protein
MAEPEQLGQSSADEGIEQCVGTLVHAYLPSGRGRRRSEDASGMRKVAKLAGPGPSLPARSSCAVRAFGIPAEVSGPPRP